MFNKPISTYTDIELPITTCPETLKKVYITATCVLLYNYFQLFVEYSDYLNHYYFNEVKNLLSFFSLPDVLNVLVIAAIHCASVIKPDFMNAFIEVNEKSCGRVNVKMNAMSVMEWQLCYLGKVRKLFYLCANDLFKLLLFL